MTRYTPRNRNPFDTSALVSLAAFWCFVLLVGHWLSQGLKGLL